jgi:hypothetical protein
MKATLLVCLLFAVPSLSFADKHGHHSHKKNLKGHVHGVAKLEIAADADKIVIDFDSPAEALLGFEHKPKSDSEKKAWEDLVAKWKKQDGFISIVPEAKCQVLAAETTMEWEQDDEHADIEAKVVYQCELLKAGTGLTLSLHKHFSHLKELKIDVVPLKAPAFSKSIKKGEEKISL